MLRIAKTCIPVVSISAALVLTARAADTAATSQSRQSSQSSASQARPQEHQKELSQQQRNQQSTFHPGEISDSQLKKTVTDVNKASSFIGMAVKNMQNEDVGKVNDLVFDPEKGKISYAVISFGGLLGVGDKLIAVPITSLKPAPGQNHLTLNMDKQQIQSAPGLAQNNWPPLDYQGFGSSPSGESSGARGSSPATSSESSTSQSSDGSSPSSSISTNRSNSVSPETSSTSGSSQGSSPATSTGSNSSQSSQSSGSKLDSTGSNSSSLDSSSSSSSESSPSTGSSKSKSDSEI